MKKLLGISLIFGPFLVFLIWMGIARYYEGMLGEYLLSLLGVLVFFGLTILGAKIYADVY